MDRENNNYQNNDGGDKLARAAAQGPVSDPTNQIADQIGNSDRPSREQFQQDAMGDTANSGQANLDQDLLVDRLGLNQHMTNDPDANLPGDRDSDPNP